MRCPLPGPATMLIATLGLGGCAAGHDYPSLAPRPIEDVSLAEPAARAAPPPTTPEQADRRYAAIVAGAKDGDGAFRRTLEAAGPTLRRGREAALGSDSWGDAQQELSRLQTARAPVVQALAALQAASEAPDAQADRGLADAAQRAIGIVRTIDAAEARALVQAAPAHS